MSITIALTREVSPNLACCELTHLQRLQIDLDLAVLQHLNYQAALAKLGCQVIVLPAEQDLPDSVFVEDVALVLDEIAVLCRPGAISRRPEVEAICPALVRYRPLVSIREPGTLEGGDVLRIGKKIYVGLSGRTNQVAIEQLKELTAEYGYQVLTVPVSGCLHLKSAVTQVAEGILLINPQWVDPSCFPDVNFIAVDTDEPYAANALVVGNGLIYPNSFPRTLVLLQKAGIEVTVVDVSELQKAEGAVTCCCLLFRSI